MITLCVLQHAKSGAKVEKLSPRAKLFGRKFPKTVLKGIRLDDISNCDRHSSGLRGDGAAGNGGYVNSRFSMGRGAYRVRFVQAIRAIFVRIVIVPPLPLRGRFCRPCGWVDARWMNVPAAARGRGDAGGRRRSRFVLSAVRSARRELSGDPEIRKSDFRSGRLGIIRRCRLRALWRE